MKISEIIDFHIASFGRHGIVPRYAVMTSRALDLLLHEVSASPADIIDRTRPDGAYTFHGLEIIVADLNRLDPVTVSAATPDEMDLYYKMQPKATDAG